MYLFSHILLPHGLWSIAKVSLEYLTKHTNGHYVLCTHVHAKYELVSYNTLNTRIFDDLHGNFIVYSIR